MERATQIIEKFGPFGQVAVIVVLVLTWQQDAKRHPDDAEVAALQNRISQIETTVGAVVESIRELENSIQDTNTILSQIKRISCATLPQSQRRVVDVCD